MFVGCRKLSGDFGAFQRFNKKTEDDYRMTMMQDDEVSHSICIKSTFVRLFH
jgi:hypothetical protein